MFHTDSQRRRSKATVISQIINDWLASCPDAAPFVSDGYHSFTDLYEFRMLYNALLFNEWARQGKYEVHKSWRHPDGTPCFGGGGWFIVVATLPTGQVSNHYREEDWDLFQVPILCQARSWDGHTSGDVRVRLRSLLEQKTPKL
jgi:hypothetical protein